MKVRASNTFAASLNFVVSTRSPNKDDPSKFSMMWNQSCTFARFGSGERQTGRQRRGWRIVATARQRVDGPARRRVIVCRCPATARAAKAENTNSLARRIYARRPSPAKTMNWLSIALRYSRPPQALNPLARAARSSFLGIPSVLHDASSPAPAPAASAAASRTAAHNHVRRRARLRDDAAQPTGGTPKDPGAIRAARNKLPETPAARRRKTRGI